MITADFIIIFLKRFRFLYSKCTRKGLGYIIAFYIIDFKAQSKIFDFIIVEIYSRKKLINRADPLSLYISLFRYRILTGIRLIILLRKKD